MKHVTRSLTIVALGIAVLCAIYVSRPVRLLPAPQVAPGAERLSDSMQTTTTTAATTPRPQVDPDRPALRRLDPPSTADIPRSPLADQLNAPGTDGGQDLLVVFSLFTHYRERYGGFPTGEDNAAFVNALTGNNPLRLAFIARSHPAINLRGQLVDRWGNPFFFHLQSRESLEVRSAGPDGELYTSDDLVKSSPTTVNL